MSPTPSVGARRGVAGGPCSEVGQWASKIIAVQQLQPTCAPPISSRTLGALIAHPECKGKVLSIPPCSFHVRCSLAPVPQAQFSIAYSHDTSDTPQALRVFSSYNPRTLPARSPKLNIAAFRQATNPMLRAIGKSPGLGESNRIGRPAYLD